MVRWTRWWCWLPLLLGAGSSAWAQAPAPRKNSVLVVPVRALQGVNAPLAEAITAGLVHTLGQMDAVHVVSEREVEKMLGKEQLRQLSDCDGQSCIAEIAGSLDADELLSGTLAALGTELVLTLSRISARDARALKRIIQRAPAAHPERLLDELEQHVDQLWPEFRAAAPSVAEAAADAPPPVSSFPRTRTPWWVAAGVSGGLAGVGGLGAVTLAAATLGFWGILNQRPDLYLGLRVGPLISGAVLGGVTLSILGGVAAVALVVVAAGLGLLGGVLGA